MIINQKRMEKLFEAMREIGDDGNGGITRLAFTDRDNKSHQYFQNQAQECGLTSKFDSIGNLYIGIDGENNAQQKIMIGSHLDSVTNGGNFDGVAGIISGFEILCQFKESNQQLNHNIELVIFRGEESTRFNRAMIGSSMVTGLITIDELKNLKNDKWCWT